MPKVTQLEINRSRIQSQVYLTLDYYAVRPLAFYSLLSIVLEHQTRWGWCVCVCVQQKVQQPPPTLCWVMEIDRKDSDPASTFMGQVSFTLRTVAVG